MPIQAHPLRRSLEHGRALMYRMPTSLAYRMPIPLMSRMPTAAYAPLAAWDVPPHERVIVLTAAYRHPAARHAPPSLVSCSLCIR
jgi:hypothetical protein